MNNLTVVLVEGGDVRDVGGATHAGGHDDVPGAELSFEAILGVECGLPSLACTLVLRTFKGRFCPKGDVHAVHVHL